MIPRWLIILASVLVAISFGIAVWVGVERWNSPGPWTSIAAIPSIIAAAIWGAQVAINHAHSQRREITWREVAVEGVAAGAMLGVLGSALGVLLVAVLARAVL
jgi:hypothetical protein